MLNPLLYFILPVVFASSILVAATPLAHHKVPIALLENINHDNFGGLALKQLRQDHPQKMDMPPFSGPESFGRKRINQNKIARSFEGADSAADWW